ncbi:unnamed protein product [Prunus armeniaca]|uniref:Uncharacterized protein n=1 Tax=Prunus armeniaca TaxID=36596 RepID=A0A6J5UAM8_PRUAR|nr:hypothetical protein GBA52_009420 [Prunus armeniaca]CAB4272185.1 unnamed protein product [Prunus armeniaca]
MQGRLLVVRNLAIKKPELLWRLMTTVKSPNRAAVHGHRLPIPRVVDEEEVEKVIERGKEEKEKKRQEVEKVVDSQLKRSDIDTCPPESAT